MSIHRSIVLLSCVLCLSCGSDDDSAAPPDGSIAQEQIAVGDFVFDARVAGPRNGELVLLLHGFPQTSYEWRAQLSALALAGYRAVAPDQRGYSPGARPLALEAYELTHTVGDAIAIADTLGAERFHLVGHDFGAGVAWGVAAAVPERVLSLTALSIPHPDPFAEEQADSDSCQYGASGYFELFARDNAAEIFLANDAAFLRAVYQDVSPDTVAQYVATFVDEDVMRAALNWFRANVTGRRLDATPIGAIRVPTLFVWSDADITICRDVAERTAEFVDAPFRFAVIEGVSHWIPDNAPDELNALLLEHLAEN